MKKTVIVILIVSLFVCLFAGCGKKVEEPVPTEAPAPAPTAAPTPTPEPTPEPEPETTAAKIIAPNALAVLCTMKKGDAVEVIGEAKGYPEYYIVQYGELFGLVRKDQVRLEKDGAFAEYTGYAKANAKFFESYYLDDAEPAALAMNTQFKVLDELDYSFLVEYNGKIGFLTNNDVSKYYIQPYSGGSDEGNDGGDIMLSGTFGGDFAFVNLGYEVPQEGNTTGKATVKFDGAELLYAIMDYGDEVRVLDIKDGVAELYFGDITAKMDAKYLLKDGEKAPASKTVYAKKDAQLYKGCRLFGEAAETLKVSTELEVLHDLGGMLVVKYNGEVYTVGAENTSESQIAVYYGGGGGGGESGDGGWTEPML